MKESGSFRALAETLEGIRGKSSKNDKVELLAEHLSGLTPEDAETAARVAMGKASQAGSRDEVQVGYSTLLELLKEMSGANSEDLSRSYLRHGDLGEVAQELLAKKKELSLMDEPLMLRDVAGAFERMRAAKGKGSSLARKAIVKSLLLRASPLEGKYLVKVLTGEMRTGLVHGLLEESIAKAFSIPPGEAARAHLLVGDLGLMARAAAEGKVGGIKLTPNRPVNFMLADPKATPEEVAEHFGKPVLAEFKYDGVRAQLHKSEDSTRIYSRRLEDITQSFPEIVDAAAKVPAGSILDGEIVPYKDGRPLPFQLLQRRLRRTAGFEEAARNAPVAYIAFDILLAGGKEVFNLSLKERRSALQRVIKGTGLERAESARVETAAEVADLFRKSRGQGYEGLVVKDPDSPYSMGKRGSGWVKLKEELDTIDAVIVAAEYGHGKRAGVISDYTFAVRDGKELRTIGKAYSGLTDQEIDEMTARLKSITVKDFGYRRLVRPEVVLEVAFDSIQRSERHDSGYALRFPRIKRVRSDKGVADIDTMERVRAIFESQKIRLGDS